MTAYLFPGLLRKVAFAFAMRKAPPRTLSSACGALIFPWCPGRVSNPHNPEVEGF